MRPVQEKYRFNLYAFISILLCLNLLRLGAQDSDNIDMPEKAMFFNLGFSADNRYFSFAVVTNDAEESRVRIAIVDSYTGQLAPQGQFAGSYELNKLQTVNHFAAVIELLSKHQETMNHYQIKNTIQGRILATEKEFIQKVLGDMGHDETIDQNTEELSSAAEMEPQEADDLGEEVELAGPKEYRFIDSLSQRIIKFTIAQDEARTYAIYPFTLDMTVEESMGPVQYYSVIPVLNSSTEVLENLQLYRIITSPDNGTLIFVISEEHSGLSEDFHILLQKLY